MNYVVPFNKISKNDVEKVGGKNANLGELSSIGLPVPKGFAITADAYKYFIKYNNLDKKIRNEIKSMNIHNIRSLRNGGKKIRKMITDGSMPADLEKMIFSEYKKIKSKYVAVRSSATAEDLPDASFAGQQESYLNVEKNNLIKRVKDCFASLFIDRAISYREDRGFDHFKVYLSVVIQQMIQSKASGVAFTIDPDTGWEDVIIINGSWGLGDYIVQGVVTPDEYRVFKPTMKVIQKKIAKKTVMEVLGKKEVKKQKVPLNKQENPVLNEKQISKLAKYCEKIHKHYKKPMDIEWSLEDDIYILQARPETVHSFKNKHVIENYVLKEKSKLLLKGTGIGKKIATGKVNTINSASEINKFKKGSVLVTEMTDPDWEPIMKKASAIVTEKGGRTSHAAIVSRELGVPAIIGVENARKVLKNNQKITVDCSGDEGKIWSGMLDFKIDKKNLKKIPKTKTKLMVNIGMPEEALQTSRLPVDGVGLAREEFIINSYIGEHPLHMIKEKRSKEFIEKLAEGIAKLAAPFYPRPVIVRMSDFKTNEYANLKGGLKYEPKESNPMIGWRGASRYSDPDYEPAFRLECKALKKCIKDMGLKNIIPMIPFCRTIEEAKKVKKIMKSEGIGKKTYVMAEIPSNIILAEEFSKYFNGFSIGSNDLTQLTLGVDRDSSKVKADERNPAVKKLIKELIEKAHKQKRKVGICGQAPSDFPEFVDFLVKNKIDSISVNPDVVLKTKILISKKEN